MTPTIEPFGCNMSRLGPHGPHGHKSGQHTLPSLSQCTPATLAIGLSGFCSLNGAGPAVNVMKGVLDMLPNGADKSTYVLALSELNTWSAATHSNAFKTVESTEFTIGSLPTWLARICMLRLLSGLMYQTTM